MGKAKIVWVVVPGVIVVLALLIFSLPRTSGEEVLLLCGGSMRAALEDIIKRYGKVSADKILATYGGSGELCAQLRHTGKGDIFICHDPFMEWAEKQGLIAEWDTVGYLDVVIVVPRGNPKSVRELEYLAQPGLRLGIGDRTYSTSGVIVKHMLKKLDYGASIMNNVRMETKGHQQRCTDVTLGALDASIVWQAVAHLFRNKLETIPIPKEHIDAITSATYGISDLKNVKVTVGITGRARDKKPATRFYQFVITEGKNIFEEYGFRPVLS